MKMLNQRADRLADKGRDLGTPSRLALTRFQDRAKMVAITQRMAVRLVDARDHLDDIAPEACNSNVEAGAIHETQSKRCYRPMLRHQTKDGRIKNKRCKSQLSLCDPTIETIWRRRGCDNETTLDGQCFHANGFFHVYAKLRRPPHSWSAESLAAFRAYVEGRPTLAAGKPTEMAKFAEHTSWLTLAVDMQLATGISLLISSGQQKEQVFWLRRPERSRRCGGIFQFSWRTVRIFFLIEKAWDFAHVGFRAERGIQAVVLLDCPTPTALSLIDWGTCQRGTPSSIQAKLARWKLHVFAPPAPGSEGAGVPFLHEEMLRGTGFSGQLLRLRELWP